MGLRKAIRSDDYYGWGLRFVAWLGIVGLPIAFVGDWLVGDLREYSARELVAPAVIWLGALAFVIWMAREDPITHDAVVMHVAAPKTDPYFVAQCECGWLSDVVGAEETARKAAQEHTPNVQVGVLER